MPEVDNYTPQPQNVGATGGTPPPAPAPSGTPSGGETPQSGEIEMARANVAIGMNLLTKQLAILGADSEDGKALLSAITALSKKFTGKTSEDIAPAELINIIGAQPDNVKQAILKELAAGQQQQAAPQGGGGAPMA